MAKPGDVVEFKGGTFGIEAPRNLGVFVERWRKKGVPWVRLVTLDGVHELKADRLTRRAFRSTVPSVRDVEDARARLLDLIGQHADGGLAEDAADDLGALEARLWEATNGMGPSNDVDLAGALFDDPSPQQLRDVRAALEGCRRPGVGRFEVTEKGDVWRPWTREERASMQAAWLALEALRRRLVVRDDTEEGSTFVARPWEEVVDADDEPTLEWVKQAMVQFVEHDGVAPRDVAGIGGLGAVQAWGMDLHRTLGFLAQDWIASPPTTRSSDYIHFLLASGLWSAGEAVEGLMRRHVNQEAHFEHVPDADAEEAARTFDDPAMEEDRTDLRHLTCHTIDPPDAKDFDDAVGIETTNEGTFLWVHIADVSHYVQQGTVLDRHAKRRATSVYLPGRVLPMLPPRLADHLCSLRDDGDRFALSLRLRIHDGRVVDSEAHRSLIRVTENLRYGDALERRDDGDEVMVSLFALAKSMQARRRSLDLDLGERRVALADGGFAVDLKKADDATRMIEVFMVAANEAVAKRLHDEDIPALYRCHPLPEPDKVRRYEGQLQTMGYGVRLPLPRSAASSDSGQNLLDVLKAGGSIDLMAGGAMPHGAGDAESSRSTPPPEQGYAALDAHEQDAWSRPFRDALNALPDDARGTVATEKMLACMGQAHYAPDNEGHFGLGLTHYCHFTSPIRRYPDLAVHRNLAWLVGGRAGPIPHTLDDLRRLCDHCSDQERAAASLGRRVRAACLVLGAGAATGPARVTGITPASLWLRFEDGVEARAAVRDLPGSPFQVDEHESMLFISEREDPGRFDPDDWRSFQDWLDDESGEMRRVRVRLGDRVMARATGRNVADGRTDAVVTAWRA